MEDALESVRRHPQHDLTLGYRQAIWRWMGPFSDEPDTQNSIGHQRRAFLATLAIRRVLPIWNEAFPNDDTPEKILAEAEQVMKGVVNEEVVRKDLDRFWEYVWELASDTKNMAVAVGLGAVQALVSAIQDEIFDPEILIMI
jgi:hypothetical protein